jgi:uncharacterized DUF497 family protein
LEIVGLVWLDDIIEKLYSKHNVVLAEVREVFDNRPWFRFAEKGHRPGENVYFACGQTDEGCYPIVFFVYKKDRRALILSARDMTRAERRKYERK